MGGYTSGRHRTRNVSVVERSLPLDIRALRRRGLVQEGAIAWRTWSWTWGPDGDVAGSIQVKVDLSDPANRHVELNFKANGEPRHQRIAVEARPMRFGGLRFYFVCPRTGRRCEVLASTTGFFASRQANRLAYMSQSETELDRRIRTRDKLAKRIWPKAGVRGTPRGANAARLLERWAALDEVVELQINQRLISMAAKILNLEGSARAL